MSKRILITGWAGFIGTNLVRYILKNTDWTICGMDALTYAAAPEWAQAGAREMPSGLYDPPRFHDFGEQNIVSPSMVKNCFKAAQPDVVINLAAETHVCRSLEGPDKFVKTNVLGTFRLLEQLKIEKESGRDILFHHVSTDEVYGELGREGKFSLQTPYAPRSPYAASKAAADHLVLAYHHSYGLNTRVSNCSNNFGPNQHHEKLIPKAILRTLTGKAVTVYGHGSQVRDWIWVDDHCAGIVAAIMDGQPGGQYLFGGDKEFTNLQVIDQIWDVMRELKPNLHRELIFTNDRPTDDQRYAIDTTQTTKDLGWFPRPEFFQERLKRTAEWYLARL